MLITGLWENPWERERSLKSPLPTSRFLPVSMAEKTRSGTMHTYHTYIATEDGGHDDMVMRARRPLDLLAWQLAGKERARTAAFGSFVCSRPHAHGAL